jgi:hypothetical protein
MFRPPHGSLLEGSSAIAGFNYSALRHTHCHSFHGKCRFRCKIDLNLMNKTRSETLPLGRRKPRTSLVRHRGRFSWKIGVEYQNPAMVYGARLDGDSRERIVESHFFVNFIANHTFIECQLDLIHLDEGSFRSSLSSSTHPSPSYSLNTTFRITTPISPFPLRNSPTDSRQS